MSPRTTPHSHTRKQRHTKHFPCPVCTGFDEAPRGRGLRCHGFSTDSHVHCSREEYAGNAPFSEGAQAWRHRRTGDCECGTAHGAAPSAPYRAERHRTKARAAATAHRHTTRTPEVAYDYGSFQVCRIGRGSGKRIWQRRPCPDHPGAYLPDLDGVELQLYHRDELLAAGPGALVFVNEGEPAVETCRRNGLLAICSPMGAGKWHESYSPNLAGLNVVVLADNDEPGRAHAEQVAASLYGIAASVRVVALPVPDKGDADDFFTQGGTREELYRLALTTPAWTPPDTALAPDLQPTSCPSCQRLRQENAALRREVVQLREERSLIFAVQRNPGLRTEKATALAVACTLASKAQAGLADTEGFVPVALGQLADDAGESTDAAGRHLKRLEAAGYIQKRVRRTWDAERQQYVSELRLRPCSAFGAMLRQAATLTLVPNSTSSKRWGGERCADHPQADIARETIDRCAVCDTELGRTSVFLKPQAAVSLATQSSSSPDSGEGPQAAGLASMTPLPDDRCCQDCGGWLRWIAAGRWACMSCGTMTGSAVVAELLMSEEG